MIGGAVLQHVDPPALLCPFGLAPDEPLSRWRGRAVGVREAVWLGLLTEEGGRAIYPAGDWSVINRSAASG